MIGSDLAIVFDLGENSYEYDYAFFGKLAYKLSHNCKRNATFLVTSSSIDNVKAWYPFRLFSAVISGECSDVLMVDGNTEYKMNAEIISAALKQMEHYLDYKGWHLFCETSEMALSVGVIDATEVQKEGVRETSDFLAKLFGLNVIESPMYIELVITDVYSEIVRFLNYVNNNSLDGGRLAS